MHSFSHSNYWALILGGSSGIGLASAQKLAEAGINIFVVHRDRRSALAEIEKGFDQIKAKGVEFFAMNVNALSEDKMIEVIEHLPGRMGKEGRVRILLHSIAKGNLKPLVSAENTDDNHSQSDLDLLTKNPQFVEAMRWLKSSSNPASPNLTEEDYRLTIHAMATSLLSWTQALIAKKLFASDARILGLTSEGNAKIWPSYGAVSAAKATLEALARTMAVELAPLGIKTNLIQAGVTDTPSLRMIPGSEKMKLAALMRNPFQRLTRPEDVANVVYLLSLDESAWINGTIIPVDGGERLQ